MAGSANLKAIYVSGKENQFLAKNTEFSKKVLKLFKKKTNTGYCAIAIDIEHFKMYNEWYGISEGDIFLSDVAGILIDVAKKDGGVCGYFGDDNFCIILPYEKDIINDMEEQLIQYAKQKSQNAGFLPVFGVYKIEDTTLDISFMYDRAVIAMNQVKGNYNIRSCEFDEEMLNKMEIEHTMQMDVLRAIKEGEFTFFLQPQCNIRTGHIIGAEALVRWRHKDKGMVSPASFIPILEKNGFIADLDCYVWEEVCKWIRSLIDRGIKPVPISVNVSRNDIYYLDVSKYILNLLKKYNIGHELLKVEITESSYVEGIAHMKETVKNLQDAGVRVMMDDFGSGYSSLNMLKSVNIDVLKLDMKFLDIDRGEEEKGIGILESVVDMARVMGLPTISEGVETIEQKNNLIDMGCLYAQGYHFFKPMCIEDFEVYLKDENLIDYNGVHINQAEKFHIRELLDANVFSDTMINNILGAIAFFEVFDDEVNIVRANENYYKLLGKETARDESDDAIEDFLQDVYEDDREIVRKLFRRAIDTRLKGAEEDIRFIKPNGEMVWFRIRVFYLNSRQNKKVFYGSVMDVTTYKVAEKQLESQKMREEKSEDMLVKMFESYDCVYLVDVLNDTASVLRMIDKVKPYIPQDAKGWNETKNHVMKILAQDAYYEKMVSVMDTESIKYAFEEDSSPIEGYYKQKNGNWRLILIMPMSVVDGITEKAMIVFRDAPGFDRNDREKHALKSRARNYKDLLISAVGDMYIDMLRINLDTGEVMGFKIEDHKIVEENHNLLWDELLGKIAEATVVDDRKYLLNKINFYAIKGVKPGEKITVNYRSKYKSKNGDLRWYSSVVKVLDDNANIATMFTSDNTENVIEKKYFEENSSRDEMTYLFNRTKLDEEINNSYSQLKSCGVIFFDVDNLKYINDNIGHSTGDKLINQVASSIRAIENANVHAYRYGGDEFIAVVCDLDEDKMDEMLVVWKDRLDLLAQISDFPCEVSVGKAWSKAPYDFYKVLEAADADMYENKKKHKLEKKMMGENLGRP